MAWEMVKANRGSGGVDGQSLAGFAAQLDQQLDRLYRELKEDVYRPQPVRQVQIPKAGKPGEFRTLGIPTIYDRVCQQALLNRLEPIFEPVLDEANFGYRRGRSTKDAMRKVWKEIQGGREWIVDADLKDFFGSVEHEKLLTLVAQRIADGRVLRLIEAMLKAGSYGKGRLFPTERGTPQGGVVSPLLSNILLTPFDQEMRRKGYQHTSTPTIVVLARYQGTRLTGWIESKLEGWLGLEINREKTRVVILKEEGASMDFLGFTFRYYDDLKGQGWRYLNVSPSEKALKKEREKLHELTNHQQCFKPIPQLIEELNRRL